MSDLSVASVLAALRSITKFHNNAPPIRARLFLVIFAMLGSVAGAQKDYVMEIGSPDFAVNEPVEFGSINLPTGNLHLEFPIVTGAQRGKLRLRLNLLYDSQFWFVGQILGVTSWRPTVDPASLAGWTMRTSGAPEGMGGESNYCIDAMGTPHSEFQQGPFLWTDEQGTTHTFTMYTSHADPVFPCGFYTENPSAQGYADDASGLLMKVNNYFYQTVLSKDGVQLYPNRQDSNGNFFTTDANGNFIDTLGRSIMTKTVSGNFTYYDVLNSQGSQSRYTIATAVINVNTNFGVVGVREYSGTMTVISSLTLPDGTAYTFNYDSGTLQGNYGVLKSVTLPAGGQVVYGFINFNPPCASNLNPVYRWMNTRTSGGGTWTYAPQKIIDQCSPSPINASLGVTVTKPGGDNTVHTFKYIIDGSGIHPWDIQTDFYNSAVQSTNLLQTELRDYGCPRVAGCSTQFVQRLTTILPSSGGASLTKKREYVYNVFSSWTRDLTEIREWNYYSGAAPTTPDRVIDATYLSSTAYQSAAGISDRPLSITLKNGLGTLIAQTNYAYDSTPLVDTVPTTGIEHHDDAFGTGVVTRGNLTSIQRWAGGSSYLNTIKKYDTTGQMVETKDPALNVTTFNYSDCFRNDNGANPPATVTPSRPTNSYLTRTTFPLTGSLNYCYYFGTGKLASTQDQNAVVAYNHYLDPLDRPTHVYLPDGGWTLSQYTSPTQTDSYKAITAATPSSACSSCVRTQEILDNLRRTIKTVLVSDPGGAASTDTGYDTNGRVQSVSNPHRSTPTSTDGAETMLYDGLDRVIQTTRADNSMLKKFYGPNVTTGGGISSQLCSSSIYGLGYPILFVDEASKKRQTWTDGFGRLIEVDEPDSTGSLAVPTCYQYDLLDNLTGVLQNGSRQRTFTYNSLSQLTSATNPESGTICYGTLLAGACQPNGYDANGNLIAKTDARGITTTFAYDALNRLTQKSYSDTTPTVKFGYDGVAPTGCTLPTLSIANGIGKRTGMCDAAGAEAWSYDVMGRPLADARTTNGVTKTTSYQYNLDGSMAALTYPSGRTITYTPNAAGRTVSAVDTTNAINYATGALYSPAGALTALTNGANLVSTLYYNNRLQPCRMSVKSSGTGPTGCTDAVNVGNVLDFNYNFSLGTADNGNVSAITNNRDATRSQSFTYDPLNRIATAKTAATTGTNCWGEQFGYDSWGNLLSISGITPQYNGCTQESLSVAATPKNQISVNTYDAAGNLIQTPAPAAASYTYNAENQLTATAGVSYLYDGDGKRVQKSNGKLYWYGMGSDPLDESDVAGNITDEYIFFNGKRIARRTSGPSSIPVQNASFGSSNPLNLSCYCGPYNNSGVPGWTSSGVGPFGSWQPNANSYNSPLPGVVAMVEVGTLSQTLTGTALQPNATYTLSVDVGHRLEGYVTTYSISLQAGPNVVATISGSNGTIPAGTFQTQTLTYAAGSAPPAGDLTIVLTSGGAQSNFKNVVLTASGSIQYYFSDHLGTARVVTNALGTVLDDSDFYPFGGERVVLSSSGNNYKFTGKERDPNSGLDDFEARNYSSNLGRFNSADPENLGAIREDPQSWNAYSYTRNNPVTLLDPSGALYCRELKDPTSPGTLECISNDEFDNSRDKFKDFRYYICNCDYPIEKKDNTVRATAVAVPIVTAENPIAGVLLGAAVIATAIQASRLKETQNFLDQLLANAARHLPLTYANSNPDPGNRNKWRGDLTKRIQEMKDKLKRLSGRLKDRYGDQIRRLEEEVEKSRKNDPDPNAK